MHDGEHSNTKKHGYVHVTGLVHLIQQNMFGGGETMISVQKRQEYKR